MTCLFLDSSYVGKFYRSILLITAACGEVRRRCVCSKVLFSLGVYYCMQPILHANLYAFFDSTSIMVILVLLRGFLYRFYSSRSTKRRLGAWQAQPSVNPEGEGSSAAVCVLCFFVQCHCSVCFSFPNGIENL